MEKIKWEELSNAEILREQLKLKNEFENLKEEIMKKVNLLDSINDNFLSGEAELRKRNFKVE